MAWFDDQATTATTEPPLAREVVELDELEAGPVRVVPNPLPTLLAVLDAARGRSNGVPDEWTEAASSVLPVRDLRALDPIVARPHGFVPDCLLGLGAIVSSDPDRAVERISRVGGDAVLAELTGPGGPGIIGAWKGVARDPAAWLGRYTRALSLAWEATRSEWNAAARLVDVEAQRVGAAIGRGAMAEAVRDVHPAGAVREGRWALPGPESRQRRLAEGGLTLIPKLTGRRSPAIRAYEGDRLSHLAYPLPGAARELGEMPPPSSLEVLLGGQRAAAGRRRRDPGGSQRRLDLAAVPRCRERLA